MEGISARTFDQNRSVTFFLAIDPAKVDYKLEQWKKTGTFYILNNISEYVKLVQLIHSLVNFESFSKCGWRVIFYSN